MYKFFASFENEDISMLPTIKEVFGFYIKMILGFGLVFQMPVLVFVLARFGIVTARFMLKQFKVRVSHHLHCRGRHHAVGRYRSTRR